MRETHSLKTSWPANYFSKLRCLHLSDVRPGTISSLWTAAALVENLTELDVGFSDYVPWPVPRLSEWASDFIRDLPLRSPHITSFAFALYNYFAETIKLSPLDLQSLQKLSLHIVYLYRVILGDGASHEDLVHAIPGVRVLRLPSLRLRSEDLLHYATGLRSLQVLSIAIDFDPDFSVDKPSHVPVTHEVLLEDLDLATSRIVAMCSMRHD
ncbi:hypothetical protein FRC07_004479 [Ceratobasidium sp. 392]|nr:hypothetical protein FRC07_004479 [Ceratobasidium sp. 392]